MSSLDTPPAKPGLRERKKQQTREKIAHVALQLFAERGYDQTTLADIAEAAEVAPRTIFAYFESKEDILLGGERAFLGELKRRLDERPPGTTTVDALREFLSQIPPLDETDMLRKKVMTETPELHVKRHARHAELEPMLAASIAQDLGAKPDDLQPMLVAASVTAAFMSVSDRIFEAEAGGEPMTHDEAMAILDQVIDFLRGGLEALQPN
jgi:AcrR family transcriptional regulator